MKSPGSASITDDICKAVKKALSGSGPYSPNWPTQNAALVVEDREIDQLVFRVLGAEVKVVLENATKADTIDKLIKQVESDIAILGISNPLLPFASAAACGAGAPADAATAGIAPTSEK